MEAALASRTQILPLKDLFSDFLYNFAKNVKGGDTLTNNPWARDLKTRIIATLGDLAESYGLRLNPIGGVGNIRLNRGQYINFCKKPLKTNRGFYPAISFSFDKRVIEYSLGYSTDNEVPQTCIATMREIGRKRLPDFVESTGQGLPMKTINLEQTTDEQLTKDLIRLLDTYMECIDQLGDEIDVFFGSFSREGERRDQNAEQYEAWIIAGGGEGSTSESFIQTNSVAINFDIREDLAAYDTEQKIKAALIRTHGDKGASRSCTATCHDFSQEIKVGDLVILRSGLREINAVGVVTSRYIFEEGREKFSHLRKVEWVFTGDRELPDSAPQFRQDTLVELDSEWPRVDVIKQLTNWDSYEAEISRIRKKVIVAAPFSKIFRDREEAHAAFDLIKETLERLRIRDPQSEQLVLSLPNSGTQMSLTFGARLALHFRRDAGQLVVSSVVKQEDLAPGERFEGGEFSANKETTGIGLKHRVFTQFLASAHAHESYLRALDALMALSNQRTPYARWHIPQLVEAAFDAAAREKLFTEGLDTFATEAAEPATNPTNILMEATMAKGRNVIYFGPPGTGKTWTLLNKERQRFIASPSSTTKQEQLQALVADEPWWVIVGAALLHLGPAKVPSIAEHPLVKARFATANVRRLNNAIWANLQSHTSPESETVLYGNRQEPFIFQKSADSVWSVNKDILAAEAPEVTALADAMDRGADKAEAINRYETVTFHQSFSYEDFIEGIKPSVGTEGTPSLGYEIQPGVFKRLCDRARADKEHEYAIFIDEINRGNVASIFGELISLIEEDKREGAPQALAVRLPYSKEIFSVPANVSIIGTMNSADRSVEALDSALRRRFSFIELAPSIDELRKAQVSIEGIDIPRLFQVINQRLEKLLNRDHQIGHAYFLELKNGDASLVGLRTLFQRKIIPLLQEYFYSDLGKIGLVLGGAFVERIDDTDLASFEYPDAELTQERPIYRLKDPAQCTVEDFRSIYGG